MCAIHDMGAKLCVVFKCPAWLSYNMYNCILWKPRSVIYIYLLHDAHLIFTYGGTFFACGEPALHAEAVCWCARAKLHFSASIVLCMIKPWYKLLYIM